MSIRRLTTLSNGDLASGSDDVIIKIWNPNDGTLKTTFTGNTGGINSLKTTLNGDLVCAGYDQVNKIWNPNDWT